VPGGGTDGPGGPAPMPCSSGVGSGDRRSWSRALGAHQHSFQSFKNAFLN